MKVTKNGKVKLEKDEIRVGNFFIRREEDHMKIMDLGSVFTHRVSRVIPVGIWLEAMWARAMNADESAVSTLRAYIGTMWSVFSVAPDDGYIKDALAMAQSALERHPEWYGVKKDATDEEDAEAAKSVEEMSEFEESMRGLVEKEASDGKSEG